MIIYKYITIFKIIMGNLFCKDDLTELNEFMNLNNTTENKDKQMNILWFKGNNRELNCIYKLYGNLGFQIEGGSIYGFGPDIGYYDNMNIDNMERLFSGRYMGKFSKNNILFETIKKDNKFVIHSITVNVNNRVYNMLKKWDSGEFNYRKINTIKFGIPKIPQTNIGFNYNKTENVANSITILDYFSPEYNDKLLDTKRGQIVNFTDSYI